MRYRLFTPSANKNDVISILESRKCYSIHYVIEFHMKYEINSRIDLLSSTEVSNSQHQEREVSVARSVNVSQVSRNYCERHLRFAGLWWGKQCLACCGWLCLNQSKRVSFVWISCRNSPFFFLTRRTDTFPRAPTALYRCNRGLVSSIQRAWTCGLAVITTLWSIK